VIIDLPWPPRGLHPNARTHWASRHKLTRACRQGAQWAAHSHGHIEADAINVTITFHEPDKRRRDMDGMLSNVKAYCDGIADAIEVDDSRWSIALRRGEVVKGGTVRFEIDIPKKVKQ
jgi:crossover junction endodeoxyribonuclease RusA